MDVTDIFNKDLEELNEEECLIRISFLADRIFNSAATLINDVSYAQGALEGAGATPFHAIRNIEIRNDSIAQDSLDLHHLQERLLNVRRSLIFPDRGR
jgi:hypothetical protein